MARPATSRDVARLAGVAQSTVSNVLTGAHPIAPETRARVEAAMAELGYRPNLAARAMRTQRTGRLAVVLPGVTHVPTRLLVGAAEGAEQGGYALEVHGLSGEPAARAERLRELAGSRQLEGVLALAPVEGVADGRDPGGTVLLTLTAFDAELHTRSDVTDASPATEFVTRLWELGHRRFLHVAGDPAYPSARARRDAYLAAVDALGATSLGVVDGDWSPEAGIAAVRALPDSARPLAVIAANDRIAAGVVRAAHERGWSVPGDVSVTGWDDLELGRVLWPDLTTVRIDEEAMGRRAVEHLIALVRGGEALAPSGVPWVPQQTIVWRGSTAAPAP